MLSSIHRNQYKNNTSGHLIEPKHRASIYFPLEILDNAKGYRYEKCVRKVFTTTVECVRVQCRCEAQQEAVSVKREAQLQSWLCGSVKTYLSRFKLHRQANFDKISVLSE